MTLWEAAMAGDGQALAAALEDDPATLNAPGPGGWPALHLAAHFGHPECVEMLLARGADIQIRSSNEMQNLATHAAAASSIPDKRAAIVEKLLDAGIAVDATQHGGFTALHSACQNEDLATIQLLLARGADINKAADDGRTPASLRKV